tara:strand:- start:1047 stop:1196 length:150 start_codon:yes stop_codon:yes gene_type:complete
MTNDRTWLIMTYYCPIHGSMDISEPLKLESENWRNLKKKGLNKDKKLNS